MTFQIKIAVSLTLIAVSSSASAEMLYENSTGGSVLLYGQFSPAYQSVDDGINRKNTVVDNAHSNTRVGLWAFQDYSSGSLSFNFETALGLRSSDGVSQDSTPSGISWDRTKLRKIDFAFDHNSWGTFSIGQGSMGADGIADISLGGNGMTTVNAVPDGAGNFQFRTAAGDLSDVAIGDVLSNLDGGRLGRVRYDTTSLGDFSIAMSAGTNILAEDNDDSVYDIALRYSRDFEGTEVRGGIGFIRVDKDGENRDDMIGSLAVKFQSGFSFALAGGSRKDDGSYGYAQVGYEKQWFSWGSTALSLDYYDGSDFGLDGRRSNSTGFGINQNFDDSNTQVYLGLRTHGLSDPTVDYKDIHSILFGARVKF